MLAVKRSNNEEALKRASLERMRSKNIHPFANFWTGFKTWDALDLVCEHRPANYSPEADCEAGPEQRKRLDDLRTKIVLIADVNGENDYHESPIGRVPGIELHASYIESLISGHYWKPVWLGWQLLASVGWFAIIHVVFETFCEHPWRALAYSLAATLVVAFIFYYVVVMLMGYYFILLPPSLILIAIRTLDMANDRRKEANALGQP